MTSVRLAEFGPMDAADPSANQALPERPPVVSSNSSTGFPTFRLEAIAVASARSRHTEWTTPAAVKPGHERKQSTAQPPHEAVIPTTTRQSRCGALSTT